MKFFYGNYQYNPNNSDEAKQLCRLMADHIDQLKTEIGIWIKMVADNHTELEKPCAACQHKRTDIVRFISE